MSTTAVTPQPEAQSEIPQLSPEQKAEVLLLQRRSLTLQLTIENFQKQLELVNRQVPNLLTQYCQQLGIDTNTVDFDLEQLLIVPKANPPAAT